MLVKIKNCWEADVNTPPTACRRCGKGDCKDESHKITDARRWTSSYAYRKQRPFNTDYASQRWKKLRALLTDFNPLCQHIEYGVRCMRPATIGHHLIDPKVDYSRFYDPSNLVAVCKAHHPGGQPGELLNARQEYAPTRWEFNQVFEHPKYEGVVISDSFVKT
jgi:hypothetical protein